MNAFIWVFCGEQSFFPSGVFNDLDIAEAWIKKHGLSGTLTEYPINVGVYDWIVAKGYFTPKYPSQKSARFIGKFSSAYLNHFHFQNGEKVA